MMTSTCLKALKIQTVQTKTIIKMTPAQLQSMIQPPKRLSDQTTPIHSTVWKDNTVPRLQEKVCGLFNQEIDSNKDTGPLDMDNITIINNNQNKSKFAIRKSNANLHINLSQTIQPPTQQTEECDLDLEHLDINNFLTPRTEMQYLSLFSSIEPMSDDNFKESNIEIDEELNCILTSELYDNTKINVQANEPAFDFELVQNESSLGLALDHAYSNKRKLSLDIEDNSIFSQDSFSLQTSSPAPSTSTEPTKKKQRTKGIYRAKDIKTDEDLANYRERREKNNKSSKISRSNKKSLHNSMDARSDELEVENNKLNEKIVKLQNIQKTLKDFILQNFK